MKNHKLTNRDNELLKELYHYQYLDLSYILKTTHSTITSREWGRKRINQLKNKGYITSHYADIDIAKMNNIDPIVYSLTEVGFLYVKEKYGYNSYDPDLQIKLKHGWLHHLQMNHILLAHVNFCDQLLPEKHAHHLYGSKFTEVIKPDGLIIKGRTMMFLEYEHSNTRRDLSNKLNRYNHYFDSKMYNDHPNVKIEHKYIPVLILIAKDEKSIVELTNSVQKCVNENYLSFSIYVGRLDQILLNPHDSSVYKKIECTHSKGR